MSMSLISASQVALINYINNVDDFKNLSIQIFSSVPSNKKPPYLKIIEISLLNQYQELINQSTVSFKIGIVIDGKNNNKICDIIDLLRKNLPSVCGLSTSLIQIINFSDFSVILQDNLLENGWIANVSFSVDVLELN